MAIVECHKVHLLQFEIYLGVFAFCMMLCFFSSTICQTAIVGVFKITFFIPLLFSENHEEVNVFNKMKD